MPKQYRLSDKILIKKCAKVGNKKYSNFFIVKKLESINKQFVIVVSKKYDKRAVGRNLIKRQCKAIIYQNIDIIDSGIYMIIIKNNIQQKNFKDIAKDILSSLT